MKMTVKEVADVLGVTPEAIKWHIRQMFPEILENGKTTMLDEWQVTEIKRKMLPTSQLAGVVTNIDKLETVQKAMSYLSEMVEEQRQAIESMKPKAIAYDSFMQAENTQSIGEVAKVFGIGRNRLFQLLRDAKILMSDNVPYQEYMGYFHVVEKPVVMGEKTENKTVTRVKPNGVDYLAKRLQIKQQSFGGITEYVSSTKRNKLPM